MTLEPGRAVSEDAAKEAALRMLTRGPRTEREVERRLLDKGFSPEAIHGALQRLRRVSLLDDRAFVRSFLRTELQRAPQGRGLLESKLKRRGVPAPLLRDLEDLVAEDPDLVERSLATEADRAAAALAQLQRRYAGVDSEVRRRRLTQGLARRGFAWDVIHDLLGEMERR